MKKSPSPPKMPAPSLGAPKPFPAEFSVANRDWSESRQRRVRVRRCPGPPCGGSPSPAPAGRARASSACTPLGRNAHDRETQKRIRGGAIALLVPMVCKASREGFRHNFLLLHQLPAMHVDDLGWRRVVLSESGISRVSCGPAGKGTAAPASMTLSQARIMGFSLAFLIASSSR
jgi:hypothetical protein